MFALSEGTLRPGEKLFLSTSSPDWFRQMSCKRCLMRFYSAELHHITLMEAYQKHELKKKPELLHHRANPIKATSLSRLMVVW